MKDETFITKSQLIRSLELQQKAYIEQAELAIQQAKLVANHIKSIKVSMK